MNPAAASGESPRGAATRPLFLQIGDATGTFTEYHSYAGGPHWRPVVRGLQQKVGQDVRLRVLELTPENFVANLSPIVFKRTPLLTLGSDETAAWGFEITGKTISIRIGRYVQGRSFEDFVLRGEVDGAFEVSSGSPRLGFSLRGLLGGAKRLALYVDSVSASMGIKDGRQFRTVRLVYSDGVRLRLVYEKYRGFNISTVYLRDPSELYRVWQIDGVSRNDVLGRSQHYSVEMSRSLEEKMLHHGTSYDHGRLGAEIAYTIAKSLFPDKNFVIPEISKGGRDLFSTDDTVSVQARLIYDFSQFRPAEPEEVLELQLGSLLRKLAQDFAYNPKMSIGVASLSYFTRQKQLQAAVSFRRKQRNDSEPDGGGSGQTIQRAWSSARK